MISLRTPGQFAFRALAVRVVGSACQISRQERASADSDFDNEVVSAFSEAFNNVAVHAYANRPGGDIEIEIDFDHEYFRIRISDYGDSYDPATVLAPELASMPESGMGLFIIKSFMDEVDYRSGVPHSGVPNVLSLTKRLRRPSVAAGAKP